MKDEGCEDAARAKLETSALRRALYVVAVFPNRKSGFVYLTVLREVIETQRRTFAWERFLKEKHFLDGS